MNDHTSEISTRDIPRIPRVPSTPSAFVRAFWPPLPVWQRLDATVLAMTVYTAIVVSIESTFEVHLPSWGGGSTILNALILGVLLGFRNKEAYDRWWEGRKLWGQLVNDSRNLALKVAALPNFSPEGREVMSRLIPGFAIALKHRLRDEQQLQRVPGFEHELEQPRHVPLFLAGRVFALIQAERAAGRINDYDFLMLDPHARAFMDVCGACERVKSSPIPLSYRSLLRHGLVLYLISTPWMIAEHLVWWTLPVMAMFTYFMTGIEMTAEDVEQPFGRDEDDLALSAFCETIRLSVTEALQP